MPSCHINGGKKVELFSFSEQSYFWPKLLDGLCCFVVKLHLQIAAFSNLFFVLIVIQNSLRIKQATPQRHSRVWYQPVHGYGLVNSDACVRGLAAYATRPVLTANLLCRTSTRRA